MKDDTSRWIEQVSLKKPFTSIAEDIGDNEKNLLRGIESTGIDLHKWFGGFRDIL
jgi:hypothetical protein